MNKSEKAKILIVDDSETNRMLLQFTLEELGFETAEAGDGEKAVEMALEQDFAAIFMDINMPKMGGIEALQALMALNFSNPIIACSAEEDFDAIEQFLQKGFAAFVPKPIEPEQVANTLQSLGVTTEQSTSRLERKHQQKVQELSNRFLDNLPVIINKLSSAIKTQDSDALRRFSHKLKANAGHFGLEKVSKISRDIESAVNKSRTDIAMEKAEFLLFELHKINDQQAHH